MYAVERAGPDEKDLIDQCIRENHPFPEWMVNAPELPIWLALFYTAFVDLMSERKYEGGFIPWSAIDYYCKANEIEGEQREDLFYHVRCLDKSYLEWRSKKNTKKMEDLKAQAAQPPKRPTRGQRRG